MGRSTHGVPGPPVPAPPGAPPGPAVEGRTEPVTFVAFDLLWADGQLLTGEAHDERRRLLTRLDLPALGVPAVPSFDGLDAAVLSRRARASGSRASS